MILELPLVTVIACCYNHERFAVECLEGIRNQTYSNIQLIITDDCSKDRSVEVIEDWIKTHEVKCRFIKHTENQGLPKTLNEALVFAEGKYVSIISTDDVWMLKFIEKRVKVFEESEYSVGVVYGRTYTIDIQGNQLPGVMPNENFMESKDNFAEQLLNRNFIPANTVMIRRSCFILTGYYDEDLVFEDYDMWLRLMLNFRFKFSEEILCCYRMTNSSFTKMKSDEIQESHAKIFIKQLGLNKNNIEIINEKLISLCHTLYKIGYPLSKKYIWLHLKKEWNKKDLLMLVFASLHIPYSKYLLILSFVQNVSSIARQFNK